MTKTVFMPLYLMLLPKWICFTIFTIKRIQNFYNQIRFTTGILKASVLSFIFYIWFGTTMPAIENKNPYWHSVLQFETKGILSENTFEIHKYVPIDQF